MIQHKKKKSNKKYAIAIIILILLIVLSGRSPESYELPSNIYNTIIGPINRIVYGVTNTIDEVFRGIFSFGNSSGDLEKLKEEIIVKDEKIRDLEAIVNQNDYLKAEYDLLNKDSNRYIQAYVTGMDTYGLMKRFTIDLGSLHGIKVNDIVVQGVKDEDSLVVEALVGRVTEVGPNYSKVSAIIDDTNDLSFRSSSTGEIGIINQKDGQYLYGSTLDENAKIKKGDSIITSGVGGVYPRGIYIGKVRDAELSKNGLTKDVSVESPVQFDKLYRVLVLREDGASDE